MRLTSRWEWLAALRFALAGIVACTHVADRFTNVDGATRLANEFGGKAAVLGFFLVSGYSIAASLQRGRHGFYRRRLLRIYPVYAVSLLVAIALDLALGGQVQLPADAPIVGNGVVDMLGNVFLLQTFLVKPLAFNGVVWSLAVEASYYLVAPLLPRLPRWFPLAVIAVSCLSYCAPRHDDWGRIYFVLTRLNAIEYAWAWFMGYYMFANRRTSVAAGFAVLGAVLIWRNDFLNPEPYAVVTYLGSLLIVFAAGTPAMQRAGSVSVARGLNFLGNVSYPMYLMQYPIFITAGALLGFTDSLAILGLIFAGSIVGYIAVDIYLKRVLVAACGWFATRQAASLAATELTPRSA